MKKASRLSINLIEFFAMFALALMTPLAHATPPLFELIDLGLLPEGPFASGNDISNATSPGESTIIGTQQVTLSDQPLPFSYSLARPGMNSLGLRGEANGISSDGTKIAGYRYLRSGNKQATLRVGDATYVIPMSAPIIVRPEDWESTAMDVNNAGMVVGSFSNVIRFTADSSEFLSERHAFIFQGTGSAIDLHTQFPGWAWSEALRINRNGYAVGYHDAVGFVYKYGQAESLSYNLSGYSCHSRGQDLNNRQVAVGYSDCATFVPSVPGSYVVRTALKWERNSATGLWEAMTLGDLGGGRSAAFAINDAGLVVGRSSVPWNSDTLQSSHGFLWTPRDGMKDLNRLTVRWPASGHYLIESAKAINSHNEIVADAQFTASEHGGTETHAVLLRPLRNERFILPPLNTINLRELRRFPGF